jgi:hypothetical protein
MDGSWLTYQDLGVTPEAAKRRARLAFAEPKLGQRGFSVK